MNHTGAGWLEGVVLSWKLELELQRKEKKEKKPQTLGEFPQC